MKCTICDFSLEPSYTVKYSVYFPEKPEFSFYLCLLCSTGVRKYIESQRLNLPTSTRKEVN